LEIERTLLKPGSPPIASFDGKRDLLLDIERPSAGALALICT